MNQLTPNQLKKEFDRPDLFSLVNSYLNLKVYADYMRDEVDKISRQVLAEVPLYEWRYDQPTERRITDPRLVYLCDDDDAFQKYSDLVDRRNIEAGLCKDDIPAGHCPALTAESQLVEIKHLIADIACPILGFDKHRLFLQGDGTKTWDKFINLVIQAVVNHPNYTPVNMYADALKEKGE